MVTTATGIATSYIQFSRASLATVTNNVGNIAWAGHNLLTNSESFDAAAWTKASVTIAANNATAPNGTTTADTITLGAGTAAKVVYQTIASTAAQCVIGVYVKIASGTVRYVQLLQNVDVQSYANFDITGNAVGTKGANTPSSAITNVGADWYYITATFSGAGNAAWVQIVDGTSSAYSSATSATGTFHLWGASLYRSDLGGMVFNPAQPAGFGTYYPTTPPNLLGYTEDWSNAAWIKGDATILANSVIAPNGLQTADKFIETTATGPHYAVQVLTGSTGGSTFSIYAKAAERTILGVGFSSPADCGVYIDLIDGSLASNLGSAPTSYAVTTAGNGWYRISVTNTGANVNNPWVILSNGSPTTARDNYTGDGISGVYVWGAQLSNSASIDPYSPVYGAAVTSAAYYAPRLDYSPTTIQPLGMLVEEQRANIIRYSRTLETTGSYWGGLSSGTANTITIDNAPGPDGLSTSASMITYNTAVTGAGTYSAWRNTISTTANGTYTFTVWLKAGTTSSVYLRFNDSGGNRANTLCTLTSSWQRFTVTGTTAASITTITCDVGADGNAGGQTLTAGTVYAYGAQLELGSFSTSYIPTGASTVTRSADVASVSTQAFPFTTTEGTIVVNASRFAPSSFPLYGMYAISDGTTANRIEMYASANSLFFIASGGATQLELYTGLTPTAGSVFKQAVAYRSSDAAAVLNGGTASTGSPSSIPSSVNKLNIGSNNNGGASLNGHIRQITYLPRRISNAELQTRTT